MLKQNMRHKIDNKRYTRCSPMPNTGKFVGRFWSDICQKPETPFYIRHDIKYQIFQKIVIMQEHMD